LERPARDKHSSLFGTFVNYNRNFFVAIILQMNCNGYSNGGVSLFKLHIQIFNVSTSSISTQSYADASTSNIARLPQAVPMAGLGP
jgi:hypothetical protein